MSSVLQEWVNDLSMKKQTVMLGALRTPDTLISLQFREVIVWLRTRVLQNADSESGFMHAGEEKLPNFKSIEREFEQLPLQAARHILLAMQVIAQEHPNTEVGGVAWKFYTDGVQAQHLNVEGQDQYEARYADRKEAADGERYE
jgi:hypothetical protein